MNVKDLIVNGVARIVGKVYSSGGFVGNVTGNVSGSSGSCTGNSATANRTIQTFDRFICYCTTSASTSAKTASCSNYFLRAGSVFVLVNTASNSYVGAITLNVNGTGAKTIRLNGLVSSSTNYTLPVGVYFVHYDGTYYNIDTNGNMSGSKIVLLSSASYTPMIDTNYVINGSYTLTLAKTSVYALNITVCGTNASSTVTYPNASGTSTTVILGVGGVLNLISVANGYADKTFNAVWN